jgi:hydrogenase/urease accessory protein HupE
MTSAMPSADSHTSGLASQPLVHLAILAVVVGIGVAIYLARRGKS